MATMTLELGKALPNAEAPAYLEAGLRRANRLGSGCSSARPFTHGHVAQGSGAQ